MIDISLYVKYCSVTLFFYLSGVILYAMVCGRLPFGDDTKVKTLLKTDIVYTRPISTGERYSTL